ncbi:MAG TPA: hypothetical protein VFR37_06165 [Longimicrobium sp.]|nr:hypothetical protein [Longimicrobium sp.]
MTQYLAERPEFAERLYGLSRELDAIGLEPAPLHGVRQPFDYTPRTVPDITRRIH